MVSIFDQILQMTGKVLGHILDWPFLLFVLVVWILVRYRDQIGSALDRRESIKRAELLSAVREELAPVRKDVGDLKVEVMQLKADLVKVEATQTEYATGRLLGPIDARIKVLEQAVEQDSPGPDSGATSDLTERLKAELDQLRHETENLKQRWDEFKPLMPTLPESGAFVELQTEVTRTRQEMNGLQEAVAKVTRAMEEIASSRVMAQEPSADAQANEVRRAEDLVPLRVMREALSSTRWEWRRVKKLAQIAGITEEKALELLEGDPQLIVKKDDWGRRIAKLSEE